MGFRVHMRLGLRPVIRAVLHGVVRPSRRHGVAHATAQWQQKHKKHEHEKTHGLDDKASHSARAEYRAKALQPLALAQVAASVWAALSSHICRLSSKSLRLKEQLSSVNKALDSSRLNNCPSTSA